MGVFLNGVARFFTVLMLFFFSQGSVGASIDDDELGTWYMTSFIKQWSDSNWGFQGDIQYRSWDHGSDLEQLLLRGGITFSPTASNKLFTFGMANITSGQFGPSRKTVAENRVYQEALMPQRLGDRILLRHRFRFEQRWVEGQDFRTRFRYALSVTIPLNSTIVAEGTWYLSFYDELFVNGQRDIGNGREVDYYDRNRLYGALGYAISARTQFQFGYMQQHSDLFNKGQLQFSLHHRF
jgi:hypothetical protein